MSERQVYLVHLRPEPGTDGVRALRQLLKIALRAFGLRAVKVSEEPPPRLPRKPARPGERP